MRTLRLREAKLLAQGHTASKWQSQDLSSDATASLLITKPQGTQRERKQSPRSHGACRLVGQQKPQIHVLDALCALGAKLGAGDAMVMQVTKDAA